MSLSPKQPAIPQVPACWRWHYQQLQSMRNRLLQNRAAQLAEVFQPLEPHTLEMADGATDELDHDLTLGLMSREEGAVMEVDAALLRIQEGRYGLCEESGQTIPPARLRAVPWTRYTREVEERREKEGLVRSAHLGTSAPPGQS